MTANKDFFAEQLTAMNNVALSAIKAGHEAGARETRAQYSAFIELVQDRASELITHGENSKRVAEIANELYEAATALMGK